MVHTKLHNKGDFDKAIETKGKYVLIHAHSGSIFEKADEFAAKYSSTCDAYSVDVDEEPKIKDYFGISQVPAAILYKDGQQVKKIEGKNPEGMKEIEALLS